MITITLFYYDEKLLPRVIELTPGNGPLCWKVKKDSSWGSKGIDSLGQDLLAIALTVFYSEKFIVSYARSPVKKIALRLPVQNKANCQQAASHLSELLVFMKGVEWEFHFVQERKKAQPMAGNDRIAYDKVVLFSGGMDSTCGLAIGKETYVKTAKLVSFSTRQDKKMLAILSASGYSQQQWIAFDKKISSTSKTKHNRFFAYRSFLFLSLAAVVARSYGANKIYQCENGILASAIPPALSITVTRHAHPLTHDYFTKFADSFFGDTTLAVVNPFFYKTKKEMAALAFKSNRKFENILSQTETCWFYYSNFSPSGSSKDPNRACGLCIPCIIRRTADAQYDYEFDVSKKSILNNPKVDFIFGSYRNFIERISACTGKNDFYLEILDGTAREALRLRDRFDLDKLFLLFQRFSKEFNQEFGE